LRRLGLKTLYNIFIAIKGFGARVFRDNFVTVIKLDLASRNCLAVQLHLLGARLLDRSSLAFLTWVKDRMGNGDWLRGQTEHCLMAVRGSPIMHLTNQTTVLYGPMRANSQKPEKFYSFVETLCPAPRYAELFSRQARQNWDGHGDEYALAAE
jgi:MT-A70